MSGFFNTGTKSDYMSVFPFFFGVRSHLTAAAVDGIRFRDLEIRKPMPKPRIELPRQVTSAASTSKIWQTIDIHKNVTCINPENCFGRNPSST